LIVYKIMSSQYFCAIYQHLNKLGILRTTKTIQRPTQKHGDAKKAYRLFHPCSQCAVHNPLTSMR